MNIEFLSGDSYSPLVLAYIGDAVFELYVRSEIVAKKNVPVNKLHREATSMVKAKAQSEMVDKIMPIFGYMGHHCVASRHIRGNHFESVQKCSSVLMCTEFLGKVSVFYSFFNLELF